jgi:hypothetical protein
MPAEPQSASGLSQICPPFAESQEVSPSPELPTKHTPAGDPRPSHAGPFTCDVDGCISKPFKRRGDLRRHSKKHGSQQRYDCPAFDCNRTGKRGFTREDKLVDHMCDGHDDDTIFTCSKCHGQLSRDLVSIHEPRDPDVRKIQVRRTCPLPRCSFKVGWRFVWERHDQKMDTLQSHLLDKHDLKHRLSFANLLEQRGFDAQTCEFVCPICPVTSRFSGQAEFLKHFMQAHFHGPVCGWHANGSCDTECHGRTAYYLLDECTSVPDEVRQHRRTILRIWPCFEKYPIWEDIKCLGKVL